MHKKDSGRSIAFADRAAGGVPPQAWFMVSAVFHYLGPSFAVLLFPAVGVLGVAWFRIASAALLFAAWTRPWAAIGQARGQARWLLLGLGACLAVMNTSFYLALERLPMSLVAAMEFVGTIGVAAFGLRTRRNLLALLTAAIGVFILIDVKWATDPAGLAWAFVNSAMFVVYIVLGHRAAADGAGSGVQRLGAAMLIALGLLMPVGFGQALDAFGSLPLVAAGIAVGICSSVIPYVIDQLVMSRLSRASFALMLSLLPAVATVIAALVLRQIPTPADILGLMLVMLGIAIHKPLFAVQGGRERRTPKPDDAEPRP